ncbi:hypothetical protein [Halocatena marina]|uniref:Uncharacterized protein n=1 Tax=Halocatena marina TaxID=2934937 RepID=A0ABD5YN00_9EURY|nr:hypothetical protein [Halocatena marina]
MTVRATVERNVSLDYAYVEECSHHAVETHGVDGIDISEGRTRTPVAAGCS